MTNLRNFIGLFLVSLLFFTACKKDAINPTTKNTNPTETTTTNISTATQTRAMAAATFASARNGEPSDTTFNDCGCYDLFDGIDFDASHQEVEAAVDAILEGLTEEEINRLFEPVCTDDGQIYESACIADCEGVTGYHDCSDEELDDYFFGGFDCEDLDNLTFPTEIELPDGTVITVNNEEELFDVLDQWYEEYGDEWEDDFEDCFTIIYPISIQFPGGEVISYNSDEDLYTGIDAWYEANPETYEEPLPIYPIDVTLPDGTTSTVSNEMEEEALWESCYGDIDYDICFDINYPITLVYPDGATAAVNSDAELEQAIDAYYEANHDSDEDIDVQYPVSITFDDGTAQEINNEAELDAAFEVCFGEYHDGMGRMAQTSKKSVLSAKRVIKGAVLSGSASN